MQKKEFLKTLAQKGYDIGFGAKKNFSSFDIINKLPSWVGFISLIVGIVQIAYKDIPFNKELSILVIFVGISIMYLETFKNRVENFEKEGVRLTELFNKTRDLYFEAKSDNNFSYSFYDVRYQQILADFYSNTIGKQVFMSQWYAHFKFFYEMQTKWIEEELNLTFFKDKLPGSLKVIFILIIILIIASIIYGYSTNFR
ncbi:SLATT domain-containing protein [Chryseobacterium paridis]|uniref:SLATT domain-containing protein n=1 Tax=Chryseobacterium paridis TaxID=2800328 RepID=A0ABS1FWX6_9FLAO|nr:SLATT domain-containing protein [Chryseobacterium paridis]MBK1896936.1 SLATT domain-containing protein [Chryseobacterium paridis]